MRTPSPRCSPITTCTTYLYLGRFMSATRSRTARDNTPRNVACDVFQVFPPLHCFTLARILVHISVTPCMSQNILVVESEFAQPGRYYSCIPGLLYDDMTPQYVLFPVVSTTTVSAAACQKLRMTRAIWTPLVARKNLLAPLMQQEINFACIGRFVVCRVLSGILGFVLDSL